MKWLLLVACSSSQVDINNPTDAQSASVVGGQLETRYEAVGYLLQGPSADELYGPVCGATLVSERVAVTAAHCVRTTEPTTFAISFGQVGEEVAYVARAVFSHKDYNYNASQRYRHDVAVLLLKDRIVDRETPGIWGARVNDAAIYVGYGRTTRGGADENEGYTNERKSAYQKVTSVDAYNVWVKGNGGGLCWGDSGGPLLDEKTGHIYGVLADFSGEFYCKEGNKMIFTDLAAERPFINKAITCSEATNPSSCMN